MEELEAETASMTAAEIAVEDVPPADENEAELKERKQEQNEIGKTDADEPAV